MIPLIIIIFWEDLVKIDFLIAKNFRGFKSLELELHGKSTVFFGINGAGKSSVLDAINILYAPLINRITTNTFKQIDRLDVSDIKFGESKTEILFTTHFGDSGLNRHEFAYRRRIERNSKKRTHYPDELESLSNHYKDSLGSMWFGLMEAPRLTK